MLPMQEMQWGVQPNSVNEMLIRPILIRYLSLLVFLEVDSSVTLPLECAPESFTHAILEVDFCALENLDSPLNTKCSLYKSSLLCPHQLPNWHKLSLRYKFVFVIMFLKPANL